MSQPKFQELVKAGAAGDVAEIGRLLNSGANIDSVDDDVGLCAWYCFQLTL